MRLIGLTGGIATGKTTVAKLFNDKYDVPVIKVDDVSRSVTKKGSPILQEVVEHFGEESLNDDGTLNRSYLRQIIITDREEGKALEGIIVPAIARWVANRLQELDEEGQEIVFVENAMMLEQGTYKNYDEFIVVTCSSEVQFERLMGRGNQTEETARGMLKLQLPLEKKEELATYVIKNNKDVSCLGDEVDRVWKEIQESSNGS